MLNIASTHLPYAACIVPEKREERTTEGGLDVVRGYSYLKKFVSKLMSKNIRVSVFIEPEKDQIDAAKSLGAPVIELHTGAYCNAIGSKQSQELNKIIRSAKYAFEIDLECHAGHGLGFNTVSSIAITVAVLGLSSIKAISPKNAPVSKCASSISWFLKDLVTFTDPLLIKYRYSSISFS